MSASSHMKARCLPENNMGQSTMVVLFRVNACVFTGVGRRARTEEIE